MRLTCSAFASGDRMPSRYTGDGDDLSPPLEWEGVPAGTASFVVICEDPDAPSGTFHHWAIFNIPAHRRGLPEGAGNGPMTNGCRQAINDFRHERYNGPLPPRGHGTHHYHFRLMALSADQLVITPGSSCATVIEATRRYLLAETDLVGCYSR